MKTNTESLARRELAKQGYRLIKSRRRDPNMADYGRYAIVDERNCVLHPGSAISTSYALDLGDVFAWLELRP